MTKPTIEIYCDAESHKRDAEDHKRKVAVIATLVREGRNWVEVIPGLKMARGARTRTTGTPTFQILSGSEGRRARWQWRCPLCDLDVQPRHENASPILDTLAEAGVSRVPLSALAARL